MSSAARSIAIALLASSAAASGKAEVVGDFKIIATPADAALTMGGGGSFNWLNVENAPVSIQQAFTGFSVLDDGYANAPAGTQIELTFAAGVLRNGPGPDLVLLDADNDLNVYIVFTSHANFSQPRVVSAAFDTGVSRTYYYGGGGVPQSHPIFAAAIDLSAFGIPAGTAVDRVRIFTEGPSGDPLALGVLLSTCPSDIDGDGVVGLGDLAALLATFGSAVGDEAWNPHADLDASGSIGLSDLAELLADFGAGC